MEILVLSFLKKFAIHKKTTGYCLWKFWFSLLSRHSQFTKNQQGTPFEKKEDFDSFLVEVESVCHQNIDKVNKRRPILHDIATGRLDDLETTHGDIINLTRECKKLEWCNVENEGRMIVIQIAKLCEKM